MRYLSIATPVLLASLLSSCALLDIPSAVLGAARYVVLGNGDLDRTIESYESALREWARDPNGPPPEIAGVGNEHGRRPQGVPEDEAALVAYFESLVPAEILAFLREHPGEVPPGGWYDASEDDSETTGPTPPAVRSVAPVPGGLSVCFPPHFSCFFDGAPGCCRRCFAPVCHARYANGAICSGPNAHGPYAWCSGRPFGAPVYWICPCLS